MSIVGTVLKPLFSVSPKDLPDLRDADGAAAQRLTHVVMTVTESCQLTLFTPRVDALVRKLDAYEAELRGFAYEGAGVGLAARDSLGPWKRRTRDFAAGAGAPYLWAVYLGAGMSLARLHRNPEPFRLRLDDPVFSWVVLDGYGFHEGFFAYRRTVARQEVAPRLHGYARRAFDHGLGRSIWFSTGANIERVVTTIGAFPAHRHQDLWAGVGLACGYTGGVDRQTLELLHAAAGPHRSQLATGVVVAAKARHQVGNPAETIELACEVLCGRSSADAAQLADKALADLPADGPEPAYEIWRERIRTEVDSWL